MIKMTFLTLVKHPLLSRLCSGTNHCFTQHGLRLLHFTNGVFKHREIPSTKAAMKQLVNQAVKQPNAPKIVKVAIIGLPNAGKSTLANKILGRRFTSVSAKVHTTREKTLGVLTENQTQVVFLDTPGLITDKKMKKHSLEQSLLIDPHMSLYEADLLMVVVDGSTVWGRARLDAEVLKVLQVHQDKTAVLVINKVDLVKPKNKLLNATRRLTAGIVNNTISWSHVVKDKRQNMADILAKAATKKDNESNVMCSQSTDCDTEEDRTLEITITHPHNVTNKMEWWTTYNKLLTKATIAVNDKTGWPHFKHVFLVSALEGDGVEDIREFVLGMGRPGDWLYPAEMVTNQQPSQLAITCIQEKLLDHLPKEIPYVIDVELVMWEEDDNGYLRAAFDIVCNRQRDIRHVLGPRGEIVKKICLEAKQELMNTFHRDCSLKLAVRMKRNAET